MTTTVEIMAQILPSILQLSKVCQSCQNKVLWLHIQHFIKVHSILKYTRKFHLVSDIQEAFTRSQLIDIEGIPVHVLSIPDLIINKRAAGRLKDLADIEALQNIG
ncbi:MAG: hypothetical protein LBU83_12575 [Bacteroidales bacterium]|jgi:hypothetical protein|nr:hypothetical protein [Bacteroidales bacterium]